MAADESFNALRVLTVVQSLIRDDLNTLFIHWNTYTLSYIVLLLFIDIIV